MSCRCLALRSCVDRLSIGALHLGCGELPLQCMQAITLFETDGGLTWRIGGNGEPIPAPKVTLLRDQPLARTQILLRGAPLLGGDHSGESKTPCEGGWRLDKAR